MTLHTHILGRNPILCAKTPTLVEQEIEGLMLAHFAVRSFLHEAALAANEDPDRLSFTHAVQVVRRRLQDPGAFPPARRHRHLRRALIEEIPQDRAEQSRGQVKSRGLKRKMSKYKVRHRGTLSRRRHRWTPNVAWHS
ncbi:MAG: hypothetical protein OXN89_12065 [Bryobacterales bacterium]|nr:hypothetical protein [Bryobacterales bacterium]